MITLQEMIVMNNGVMQRVLVPVRSDSTNGNQPNSQILQPQRNNSSMSISSANTVQNIQPTMGYHNVGLYNGQMNVNMANMAQSVPNSLNQNNFAQANNPVGGASCPVCLMLFPLSIKPENLREHISRCQDREIAYASQLAMMNSKKRPLSSTDWNTTSDRNVTVAKRTYGASSGDQHVAEQASGLDLLLGAANKAAKLKSTSYPGEKKAKSSYCQSCNELTPADRRFCHSCGTRKKMSSCYRGVCANRGKWQVQINANGKRHYLGYFPSEIAAAQAYDSAALYFHGDRAKLNFDAESARKTKKPDFLVQIINQEKMRSKLGTLASAEIQVSDVETSSHASASTTASSSSDHNVLKSTQYLDLATSALVETSILANALEGKYEAISPPSSATCASLGNLNDIIPPPSTRILVGVSTQVPTITNGVAKLDDFTSIEF